PALHPAARAHPALDLRAETGHRAGRTGLEELRGLQGRRAAAAGVSLLPEGEGGARPRSGWEDEGLDGRRVTPHLPTPSARAPPSPSGRGEIISRTCCRLSAMARQRLRISSVASSRSGTITVI